MDSRREKAEQVKEFVYLSSLFTNDGKHDRAIERRVNAGNKVNRALLAIMNSKSDSRQARLAIHNGVLIPTLVYSSESWAIYLDRSKGESVCRNETGFPLESKASPLGPTHCTYPHYTCKSGSRHRSAVKLIIMASLSARRALHLNRSSAVRQGCFCLRIGLGISNGLHFESARQEAANGRQYD
ncbi:hypothetical protein EVAR_40546_1 [Eumeta japonica]|uniref:Uncharacterized protein n=1 Tax=Eumeta variegata TaxID=151549 RepID=A0A4C1XWD1_EUMVA|nr:hypothetical protein EVAR_40546_1 [Eumeta japonica]